jgi:hypothetical protein
MNELEGDILRKLNNKGFKNFPQLLGMGIRKKKPY